jgi:ABC-2 type transport system ATP-binding protein/lipopolysaccharide transport system ATP-binding protein
MSLIELNDVGVKYRIYNAQKRSIKSELWRRVGGSVSFDEQEHANVTALSGINLSISAGDRVALIGGNGAGKSTLLRVLAGIIEPCTGIVKRQGKVSSLLDMSMGLDPEATGIENIIVRSVILGATFVEARSRVKEIEEFSGLGEFLHFPLRTYSTGMALRLSFAIATSAQPEILILDEMIGTGDASFSTKARERLREFISSSNIMVLATHNLASAKQFCNRGIVMSRGAVLTDAPIDEAIDFYGKEGSGSAL